MRITTLIENLVYDKGLVAEHGLSMYIEAGGLRILFDTGQSGLFMHNASKLGIRIEDVDVLVLSHGHYDHTGGLNAFLQVNKKALIYAGKGVFDAKFSSRNDFIGIEISYEKIKDRIQFADEIFSLRNLKKGFSELNNQNDEIEEVYLMPKAELCFENDLNNRGLYVEHNGEFTEDKIEDEIFIVVKSNSKINIITACSHRGIRNICHSAAKYFKSPVGLIIGGFHTKGELPEKADSIADYLKSIKPDLLGVCHCTGVENIGVFSNSGLEVFYNYTGRITSV